MAEAYHTADEVLHEARNAILSTRLGLEGFQHGPTPGHRQAGIRNVIVWGRCVTNVLQHIRTFDRLGFNAWYEPRQAEMAANPRFRYLYELRSQLLKEGTMGGTSAGVHIDHLNTSNIDFSAAPPNAKGFFIGDRLGGSGWHVEFPDGTTEDYYAQIPGTEQVRTWVQFATATAEKGLPPPPEGIEDVLTEYLAYLDRLVADAVAEFGHK